MNYLNSKLLLPAMVAVVILVLGGGGYLYYRQTQANNNPQSVVEQEVKKIVSEVGKLIDLPTGEDPTLATVTDITKLKDQPFFTKAKNGDKVLIYTNAKKAILYDPILKKVLDVAPINIGTSSATPAQQATQAKIALRNGTTTVGLTTKVEGEIKSFQPQATIASKENATKATYDKTVIIVLNDSFKDAANSLINILKGSSIEALPEGEIKPTDADILIILGKDRT